MSAAMPARPSAGEAFLRTALPRWQLKHAHPISPMRCLSAIIDMRIRDSGSDDDDEMRRHFKLTLNAKEGQPSKAMTMPAQNARRMRHTPPTSATSSNA